MLVKIAMRVNKRYVYSQARIEDWEVPHVLEYISELEDIQQYIKLCRCSTFKLDFKEGVKGIGDKPKINTYVKRVITDHCTVIFMDRNINYKTHSPFTLFVNGNVEKVLPGYHSTEYEKELEIARNALLN